MEKKNKHVDEAKASKEYRGVDVNIADDEKVTPGMVKKDVKELNNNPRNDDMNEGL